MICRPCQNSVPGCAAMYAQRLLEPADAMRHAADIRMHREAHHLRALRLRLGIQPIELRHRAVEQFARARWCWIIIIGMSFSSTLYGMVSSGPCAVRSVHGRSSTTQSAQ